MAEPSSFNHDIDDALRRGGADRLPSEGERGRFISPRRGFRLPFDPRPSSPRQVALAGILLLVIAYFGLLGRLYSGAAFNAGAGLLLVAGISWLIRPRRRTVVWRQRRIDMTGTLSCPERLYFIIYRGN